MKKLFFTALFILVTVSISAQKNVNIDNLRFNYKERNQPEKSIEPKYFYYSLSINMPVSVTKALDEENLYNSLVILGQREAGEGQTADFAVNATLGDLYNVTASIEDRFVEKKDKDGKVTGREYYYWVQVKYAYDATAVFNKGETLVQRYTMSSTVSTLTYKSDEFSSRKAAKDYWDMNKDELKERLLRDVAVKSIQTLSMRLSREYGFSFSGQSGLIKTINEKKHDENLNLRENSAALKARLEALDGTTPIQESELADIIAYFKGIPPRYTDLKIKADIRLRYVAYYNLARIYLFLDQPDNVKEWADLILENGHDKKDSQRLQKDADKLKEEFAKAGITTKQFTTDKHFD